MASTWLAGVPWERIREVRAPYVTEGAARVKVRENHEERRGGQDRTGVRWTGFSIKIASLALVCKHVHTFHGGVTAAGLVR